MLTDEQRTILIQVIKQCDQQNATVFRVTGIGADVDGEPFALQRWNLLRFLAEEVRRPDPDGPAINAAERLLRMLPVERPSAYVVVREREVARG